MRDAGEEQVSAPDMFEQVIDALDRLHSAGLTPTHITVPPDQFDALDDALDFRSTWRWGLPYIAVHGPGGEVQVRRPL